MKKLYLILFFALSILSLNAKTKTEGQVCKHYSVEWQGAKFPIFIGDRLVVYEYNDRNKKLKHFVSDTIYEGCKFELISHSKTAYVVVCIYNYKFLKAYQLIKLEGEHPKLIITKDMLPGLLGAQKLNKNGEIITTNKNLAPTSFEEFNRIKQEPL